MAIDTLKVAKRLREAGFTEPQAEAVIAAVQEGTEGAELATRADLAGLRAEFKADLAELRSELRETELRLEAKIEAVRSDIAAVKADVLNRVFSMILGALVVNIIAVVGAVFAVAKLVAH
jgi:chromosome segregation and condensation protein ScpB